MDSKEQKISHAIITGDLTKVKELLDYVDINFTNNNGDSLLMVAVLSNKVDIVRYLLEKGANAIIFNKRGQTPLAYVDFLTKLWEHVESPLWTEYQKNFKEILELLEGKI